MGRRWSRDATGRPIAVVAVVAPSEAEPERHSAAVLGTAAEVSALMSVGQVAD